MFSLLKFWAPWVGRSKWSDFWQLIWMLEIRLCLQEVPLCWIRCVSMRFLQWRGQW